MKLYKKVSMMRAGRMFSLGVALSAVAIVPVLGAQSVSIVEQQVSPSIFSVYANNRERGIPNHITADLALVSYSLLRQNSIHSLEEHTIIPQFVALVNGLEEALDGQRAMVDALPEESIARKALETNIQFVQLLQALMNPERVDELDAVLQEEYWRIINADNLHDSYLWGRRVDYTQYKPRGRYTRDEQSEQFFRAFRYVSGQWFAIKPSAATGITSEESQLQTAQLVQLVQLIAENESLQAQRLTLEEALSWQFGAAEDLLDSDVVKVLQDVGSDQNYRIMAQALFDHAVENKRQPSVIDAVVDRNLLESDVAIRDVVSGWRLIPSRLSVQMATQQALLYDQTGDYVGDADDLPFAYGIVDGQGVKAYPGGREWLALIGGDDSSIKQALLQSTEVQFVGYQAAYDLSQRLLQKLVGAEQLHAEIIRTGLNALDSGLARKGKTHLDEQTLSGFQAWQRFLDVLYTRQSYTASAKGLMLVNPKRHSASLDIATDLYLMLGRAARVQRDRTGAMEWQAFSDIMDELADLSAISARGGAFTETAINYLNDLDQTLLNLTGGPDSPVVVDVHTNPNENQVVQQGTGHARIVFEEAPGQGSHRGARMSFHEFKQPIAERLSVKQWHEHLDEDAVQSLEKTD